MLPWTPQKTLTSCCCLPCRCCCCPAACCSSCPATRPSQPYVARCARSSLLVRLMTAVNLLLLLLLLTPGEHRTAVKGCLKACRGRSKVARGVKVASVHKQNPQMALCDTCKWHGILTRPALPAMCCSEPHDMEYASYPLSSMYVCLPESHDKPVQNACSWPAAITSIPGRQHYPPAISTATQAHMVSTVSRSCITTPT